MLQITPKQYAKNLITKFTDFKVVVLGCGKENGNPCVVEDNISQKNARQLSIICVNELYELSAQLNSAEMINYFTDVLSEINSFK